MDIARYTQKDHAINTQPKYHVKSSFTEKYFSKKALEHPLKWVDGINLVTFAMLRAFILKIVILENGCCHEKNHPKHNDLVLGNIIVQGEVLIPIDLNDSRRDADLHRCISSALKAFKEGNTRHRNPERWMQDYYQTV